jgi:hypothetical protein
MNDVKYKDLELNNKLHWSLKVLEPRQTSQTVQNVSTCSLNFASTPLSDNPIQFTFINAVTELSKYQMYCKLASPSMKWNIISVEYKS